VAIVFLSDLYEPPNLIFTNHFPAFLNGQMFFYFFSNHFSVKRGIDVFFKKA